MQAERHLSDADMAELPAGDAAIRGHLAECQECGAAWSSLAAVRDAMRADLARVTDRPQHFWVRQQARSTERMAAPRPSLRWPVLAMAAVALISLGLISARTSAPARTPQTQAGDADDLLLKDIQHSLAHRAPEPLMPASVLVQEITTNSNDQKRDN